MSLSIQTAINNYLSDWLQLHPLVLQLLQILVWATDHPIISLIILVLILAIAWSLIKAVSRLIEITGLSLLQAPFKLGKLLIIVSAKFLSKVGGVAVKQVSGNYPATTVPSSKFLPILTNKQRLVEISTRLAEIHKEQNELLQEAATILDADQEI